MRQYCTARAEEDEQGNVHVDESEDVMEEEEANLDEIMGEVNKRSIDNICLLYTSPSPRDRQKCRMPSSA